VRAFSDCEVRWFYEHLLGLTDPATATMALDNAIRTALMTNFRNKIESKEDIEIVVFRAALVRARTEVAVWLTNPEKSVHRARHRESRVAGSLR
jgi:hypothetical protein